MAGFALAFTLLNDGTAGFPFASSAPLYVSSPWIVRMGAVTDVARVVLALEDHDVAEEVMHFLDRSGHVRVVATAVDDRQLAEAVRQLEPDAVIAQPTLVHSGLGSSALLALDTHESVAALRAAIRAGARGYYLWPAEREELTDAALATVVSAEPTSKRALVVTVFAPRGGSGGTFVATHLASAFARRKLGCVLIDADVAFADVTTALGAFANDGAAPRTLGDLAPLMEELDGERLGEALWRHPEGFGVLLAPDSSGSGLVEADHVRGAISAAAGSSDVVVVHAPRALEGYTRVCIESADRTLAVLSLDVLSFRAATRALEIFSAGAIDFVVNRARRSEVTPSDVARVFGRPAIAVLPYDGAAARAQDHGRLLPARSRVGRAIDKLAGRLAADHV